MRIESSSWCAGAIGGDPLVAMALVGRATTSIGLGDAVLPDLVSR